MNNAPDTKTHLAHDELEPKAKQATMKRARRARDESPLLNLLTAIRAADANRTANIASVADRIADLGPDPSDELVAARLGVETHVLEASPSMFAATLALIELLPGHDLDEATRAALRRDLGIVA